MKTKIALLFVIAAACLLAVGCSTTAHVPRWEYKLVAGSRAGNREEWRKEEEEVMDKLGGDGWQLVAVTENDLWFKRQVK